MATTAIRPPRLQNPAQAVGAGAGNVGAQVSATGTISPSSIAKPPSARQTPTGGGTLYNPTQSGAATPNAQQPSPIVNAAVKQVGAAASAGTATPKPAPAGAPDPGMPNTTPNPIPLQPADEANIANANANYYTTQAAQNLGMQNAALGYGDPNLMPQWGLPGTPNPNSSLAIAALRAQEQTEADQNARARTGTLFSSLMGEDVNRIAATQQRSQLAGYQRYLTALAKFRLAMQQAGDTRDTAIRTAQADERQQALNNLPTPDTASGSFAPGNITSPTPRVTSTKAPTVAKGAKGPKPSSTKVPSTKSSKPSSAKVPSRKK
jgi:hypothetical protein